MICYQVLLPLEFISLLFIPWSRPTSHSPWPSFPWLFLSAQHLHMLVQSTLPYLIKGRLLPCAVIFLYRYHVTSRRITVSLMSPTNWGAREQSVWHAQVFSLGVKGFNNENRVSQLLSSSLASAEIEEQPWRSALINSSSCGSNLQQRQACYYLLTVQHNNLFDFHVILGVMSN